MREHGAERQSALKLHKIISSVVLWPKPTRHEQKSCGHKYHLHNLWIEDGECEVQAGVHQ